jgi:hypothetical protein
VRGRRGVDGRQPGRLGACSSPCRPPRLLLVLDPVAGAHTAAVGLVL